MPIFLVPHIFEPMCCYLGAVMGSHPKISCDSETGPFNDRWAEFYSFPFVQIQYRRTSSMTARAKLQWDVKEIVSAHPWIFSKVQRLVILKCAKIRVANTLG